MDKNYSTTSIAHHSQTSGYLKNKQPEFTNYWNNKRFTDLFFKEVHFRN
jgi:hypothetical protein